MAAAPESGDRRVRVGAVPPASRNGMTAAQARAVCPTCRRPSGIARTRSAPPAAALADVAATVEPTRRVDRGRHRLPRLRRQRGAVRHRKPSSRRFSRHAPSGRGSAHLRRHRRARSCRHASPRATGGGVRIVAAGDEAAYLAPLPVALLDPDAATAATLAAWGVDRIGQLAALPAGEIAHRLGADGDPARRGWRAATTTSPPLPDARRRRSSSRRVELEYGIDRVEPLLFVLRRLLDRMTGRLALHGLACGALELRPRTRKRRRRTIPDDHARGADHRDQGAAHARPRAPRAPAAARRRRRAHDHRHHHTRATDPARFLSTERSLPAALAATIARLAALCGPDRVGAPVCRVAPTDGVPMAPVGAGTAHGRQNGSPAHGRRRCAAPRSDDTGRHRPHATGSHRIALRAFRRRPPLEVFESARTASTTCAAPGSGDASSIWRARGACAASGGPPIRTRASTTTSS